MTCVILLTAPTKREIPIFTFTRLPALCAEYIVRCFEHTTNFPPFRCITSTNYEYRTDAVIAMSSLLMFILK